MGVTAYGKLGARKSQWRNNYWIEKRNDLLTIVFRRLLFIDMKDDESSESDSETGETKTYRPKHSKSDTDYVQKQNVRLNAQL